MDIDYHSIFYIKSLPNFEKGHKRKFITDPYLFDYINVAQSTLPLCIGRNNRMEWEYVKVNIIF